MSFAFAPLLPTEPSYIQKIENEIEPLDYPNGPGVYVMISRQDETLYTGKSKNLRQRMYAHIYYSHSKEVKKIIKNEEIKEIRIFCCRTELDATVLERYFIQGVQPTFRKFCTLSKFQPKKADFLYVKKSTFLSYSCSTKAPVRIIRSARYFWLTNFYLVLL